MKNLTKKMLAAGLVAGFFLQEFQHKPHRKLQTTAKWFAL